MTDGDAVLGVLDEVAVGIRGVLDGLEDWGLAGTAKASQYFSDLAADEVALTILDRAGFGVLSEESGITDGDREVLVVMERGNVVRSPVDQVRITGRDTAGVRFALPGRNDSIVAVARNAEAVTVEGIEELEGPDDEAVDGAESVVPSTDAVPSSGPDDDPSAGETTAADTGDDA